MAESNPKTRRKAKPKTVAPQNLAPLAALLLGLLFVWTVSVFALRNIELDGSWSRQLYPLVLWAVAVFLWIRWQRPAAPARWLGLLPLGRKEVGLAVGAFAVVFAWNAIRVMLSRSPGGVLVELPVDFYLWIVAGVFANEVMFRGVVQTRLAEAFGPAIAIPLAALATVIFRIPGYFTSEIPMAFDPLALADVFLMALIAGALRHFGRSLWPAIGAQWANAFGSLL